jgi:hypothetical protein
MAKPRLARVTLHSFSVILYAPYNQDRYSIAWNTGIARKKEKIMGA